MSLVAGTRLGPYEIQAAIGAGGMGEVYKARDTRLDRTVAIKVLPPDVSSDPDRRARFEREAKTIAGLNHPHICTLYDVGEHPSTLRDPQGGPEHGRGTTGPEQPTLYIVMEYLAGETLGDLLARKGRLSVEQALEYGVQAADALAGAHRQGVVHRDLKPDNLMVTKSGIKLLDFGVARLTEAVPDGPRTTTASTVVSVTGTVPYMAPEQVYGGEVGARTDIFALGAVLYEMVTGRRAFAAGSPAGVMAAILEHEPPPLATLQPLTPPALDRLVRQCLAKSPDDRPDTAHDVANDLRWLRESSGMGAVPGVLPRRGRGVRTALVVAAGLALVALGAASMWIFRPATSLSPMHSLLSVSPAETLNAGGVWEGYLPTAGGSRTALAWTPDGRALVYVGRQGSIQRLYARRLDQAEARPLAGTEGAQVPAVSPDGRWVAFWARKAIRKVAFAGGPVVDLVQGETTPPWGLTWDTGGTLLLGGHGQAIRAISAEGSIEPVTSLGSAEMSHGLPWPLPGGRALLYTVRKRAWSWGDEEVVAQARAQGTRRVVLRNAADARYLPTGHVVFLRQGRLFAVPFDAEHLQVSGQEVPVVDDVAQALASGNSIDVTGAGQFAVADTGALAWLSAPVAPYADAALVTVDRQGQVSPLPADVRSYGPVLRVSPDGRRLAVTIMTRATMGLSSCDVETGRLTPQVMEGECNAPAWSPDGQRLAFWWLKEGQASLAIQPTDGTAPPQVLVPRNLTPTAFTADGRQIVVVDDLQRDISIATVENGQAAVRPLLQTPEKEQWAELSPDGRWLAYGSELSGRMEVWVKPYPTGVAVPVEAGGSPAWHPNGRELFFVGRGDGSGRRWMMAVDFTPGAPRPSIGRPRPLFQFDQRELAFLCTPVRCYDVARDGQRFYVTQLVPVSRRPPVTHINLITNWFEELKVKVPRQ